MDAEHDALPQPTERARRRLPGWARTLLVILLLYLFLVGVRLLEGGIKGIGGGANESLFQGISNPIAALAVGVLATVLVQSSSVTTATIVALVAEGSLPFEWAIPMIMGANIGTTVTNTLVSLGHARRSDEFKLAFTAATMHDFFNVLAVAVILPLEYFFHILSNPANALAKALAGGEGGAKFNSPIKDAVKWGAGHIETVVEAMSTNEKVIGGFLLVIGLAMIFFTLTFITKNMKILIAARIERSLNAVLAKSGVIGMVVGMLITMAVQSSSITTSILIPLVASGLIVITNAYPITLGANVGTTVTALLAALAAGSVAGLAIAFVHLAFNLLGILFFYPLPQIRHIPITLASRLAGLAVERKWAAVAYVAGAFVALPALIIFIT
ncbi:MAG: Na/Pi symporter [Actinomycetota bacterium]